jgi:hypothetical protein
MDKVELSRELSSQILRSDTERQVLSPRNPASQPLPNYSKLLSIETLLAMVLDYALGEVLAN